MVARVGGVGGSHLQAKCPGVNHSYRITLLIFCGVGGIADGLRGRVAGEKPQPTGVFRIVKLKTDALQSCFSRGIVDALVRSAKLHRPDTIVAIEVGHGQDQCDMSVAFCLPWPPCRRCLGGVMVVELQGFPYWGISGTKG